MNCELYQHQIDALKNMHNGCILYGKVGCGKSRTALAYTYICELGGSLKINGKGTYTKPELPKDLYIITTAKKRDSLEWEEEVAYFCLPSCINVVIDSWNNIKKYQNVHGAMFIFDEQRVVGRGTWVKAFLKISRKNHWILLSGTPGDTYTDYIPVLVANGYYKNRTQFNTEHVVYKPYMKYPSIDHYINTKRLDYYISQILVTIDYQNKAVRNYINIVCKYDKDKYKRVMKDRWDIYDNCPIEETGKLCYLLRRVSNDDVSRYIELDKIIEKKKKLIIFYNFSYELNGLRQFFHMKGFKIGEWNGERHTDVPTGNKWVYLCQYTAASEGWNCTTTDTVVFFSQNYSYKIMEQAAGRIDRANTPYQVLYYYTLRCSSPIDLSIRRAIQAKGNFSERMFLKGATVNASKEDRKAS